MNNLKWEVDSIRFMYSKEKYDEYSQVALQHDFENGLYFHGTLLQNLRPIYENGFLIPKGIGADNWYGNGAYFTNALPYAQHYIGRQEDQQRSLRGQDQKSGFQRPQQGNVVYVIGALLKPGTCALVPPDSSPPGGGYVGPHRRVDDPEPGFDSHVAYVTPTSPGMFGFRPCAKNPDYKENIQEMVIFDAKRALPRFIIGLKFLGSES